ncbi:MAG: membrane-bound lytic murein transglycosylase B [Alphaproteobacteria bacterium]|jgi:membrane-bound lytic murein transglycosylase B
MKQFFILSAVALFGLNATSAQAETFAEFLDGVRTELTQQNISVDIFNDAMKGITRPDKSVYKKLKKQPESTFTFEGYLGRLASPLRIANGQKMQAEHNADLDRIQEQYKLPQEIVLALWGVESAYGKLPGKHKIIPSLASLAYESHRRTFFNGELIKAVKIVQDGHITLDDMEGSWAGAMGQCQFMPSSFYSYAKDGNSDGRIDIWQTEADVFASASNYITRSGWNFDEPWGEAITLTKILPKLEISSRGLSKKKTVEEWYKLGVAHKKSNTKNKISKDQKAYLFMPDGPSKRAYLVYNNFGVIMKWNRSSYFAFSVLTLADKIAGRAAL